MSGTPNAQTKRSVKCHVYFPTKTKRLADRLRGDVSLSLFLRRLIEKEAARNND